MTSRTSDLFGTGSLTLGAYTAIASALALTFADMGALLLKSSVETYVRMPDATTLPKSRRVAVLKNGGSFPLLVQDYGGGVLASLAPGEEVVLYCTAVATSAGVWMVDTAPVPARGFEAAIKSTAQGARPVFVQCNAATGIVAYQDGAAALKYKVCTLSNGVWTPGAEQSLSAATTNVTIVGCKLDTDKVLFAYGQYSRIVTLAGTTPTNRTELTLTTASAAIAIAPFSTDRAALVQGTRISLLTAIGVNTITQSEKATLGSPASYAALVNVGTDRIVCCSPDTSTGDLNAATWTLSGTTITFGGVIVLAASAFSTSEIRLCKLDTDRALCTFVGTGSRAVVLTSSGSTTDAPYGVERLPFDFTPATSSQMGLAQVGTNLAQLVYITGGASGAPFVARSKYIRSANADLFSMPEKVMNTTLESSIVGLCEADGGAAFLANCRAGKFTMRQHYLPLAA